MLRFPYNRLRYFNDSIQVRAEKSAERLVFAAEQSSYEEMVQFLTDHPPSPQVVYMLMIKAQQALEKEKKARASEIGKSGGVGKATKLKEPKEKLCKIWAEGKYKSRDVCAEQEYSELGFASLKAARNTLIGTPDPDPWYAIEKKGK